jgi:DNA (cytosine-5)-methyltransferase 1
MKYRTIDLCAGIGGIRRGFEMTGHFKNVLSAEIDEMACVAYQHLYHEDARNDLTSATFKKTVQNTEYDVLLAGFPCQTFSRAGKQKGFDDPTKGIIFYHIMELLKFENRPKCVFLENVDHLVSHDQGHTFYEIISQLDQADYQVVGVSKNENGKLIYDPQSFIRNSKNFGIPQNRPRIYIVAFDRKRYGNITLPTRTPMRSKECLYENLNTLLDTDVPGRFFMSSGYLDTLEKHAKREKDKGNGFGYKIVNLPDNKNPIANTILATGGSGKERNLIYDPVNGVKYAGKLIGLKKSPVNTKNIRTMTPNEWGKLQGFVNYAFKNGDKDTFSFPEAISITSQYKLFGNAVSIPVIKSMADFVYDILKDLDSPRNGTIPLK